MIKLIIFIIIILIIFYILNRYILNKDVKEHYLTYYLPFYDTDANDLANFYLNDDNNKNYLKKKFDYDIINFGSISKDKNFSKNLLNYYISRTNLYSTNSIIYKDRIKIIDDLISNKLSFCLTTYTSIVYYSNFLKKDISNIKLVTTLYYEYLFFFTKKKYGVTSINKIPTSFIIVIMNNPDSVYLSYEKILKDLGFIKDIDYHAKFYNTYEELFNGFVKEETNLLIILEIFPSKIISDFIDNNINEEILLLPFDINNKYIFLKKNSYLTIESVDLNKLSRSYLPKTFNNRNYNKFNPDINLCCSKKVLFTNKNTDSKYTYGFIKFFFENYKYLNNNLLEKGYEIKNITINNTFEEIDYHTGVLDYFKEVGYISNIDNNNCKYLLGKMKCNETNLIANNLVIV